MPRQEYVLTVFVASPSDVDDERTRLEEVIEELNVTWSRDLGVRLDLVRWETHAYPGIGDDAQAVINEQMPDDYDFFVGIMWCRYGTSTGRAESGTVEEFERAKARYESDPASVKLMIYFKDAPIPPSRLDPSQLAKVNEFRESLGEEGTLYWNFTSQDHFEKLVRLHLTRQVQAWTAQLEKPAPTDVAPRPVAEDAQSPDQEIADDDLGILDLMEVVEDRFEQLTTIVERIGTATQDLGSKISQRTAEMNQLPKDAQGHVSTKTVKRLIASVASNMDEYTARMDAELPIFSKSLSDGMNALIRAASMSVDLDTNEAATEQAKEGLQAIATLLEGLTTSKASSIEFRETIAALPRMTSELNRAKRGAVSVLDRLIAEFTNGQSLLREAEVVVGGLRRNENDG